MSRTSYKNINKQKMPSEMESYTCRWCGKEKKENKFFKCSIDHNALICQDCIKKKYKELLERTDKAKAILICCHHLNIAFLYDIYKSLNIGEGIGIYVRQLNLTQNRNPENFEEGLINHFELDNNAVKNDWLISEAKKKIDEVIKNLEVIHSDL